MGSFITQHNATDVANFEGACNWHADCRNVHQSCCLWIECSFLYHKPSPKAFQRIWQYIQPANRPHNRRPRITTPAQDLHIQHLHLQDCLRPTTWTADATIGLHNQRSSAQTVRNHLREAHLHAHRSHRGLDLTAVRRRSRLEWANAHIRWRGVLFTMNPGFHCTGQIVDSMYGVVWVNVVDRVGHGGGGVMVWVGVCYGQQTQVHFIDGILNAQRYRDEILRPKSCAIHPRPSPHVAAW